MASVVSVRCGSQRWVIEHADGMEISVECVAQSDGATARIANSMMVSRGAVRSGNVSGYMNGGKRCAVAMIPKAGLPSEEKRNLLLRIMLAITALIQFIVLIVIAVAQFAIGILTAISLYAIVAGVLLTIALLWCLAFVSSLLGVSFVVWAVVNKYSHGR